MKMYDVFSWYGFQHETCKESCFQQLIRSCAYLQMYGAIHYAVQVKANRKAASPPDWLVCIQVHWIKRKNLAMKNWFWQDFKARDVMKSCYPIGVCRVNAKQTGHRLLKWCACCGRQVPTAITVGIGLFIRFMLPIPEGLQMWSFCVLLSPFQDCSLLFIKASCILGSEKVHLSRRSTLCTLEAKRDVVLPYEGVSAQGWSILALFVATDAWQEDRVGSAHLSVQWIMCDPHVAFGSVCHRDVRWKESCLKTARS